MTVTGTHTGLAYRELFVITEKSERMVTDERFFFLAEGMTIEAQKAALEKTWPAHMIASGQVRYEIR